VGPPTWLKVHVCAAKVDAEYLSRMGDVLDLYARSRYQAADLPRQSATQLIGENGPRGFSDP
jgi:hypothetical protein